MLKGACEWIRKYLKGDRTRLDLATLYIDSLSMEDAATLRSVIELVTRQQLPDDEGQAKAELCELLADLSKSHFPAVIDLTLLENIQTLGGRTSAET